MEVIEISNIMPYYKKKRRSKKKTKNEHSPQNETITQKPNHLHMRGLH